MAEPAVLPEQPRNRTGHGCREVSAPCVMMDAMDTQSPTYFDDELTASLVEHLPPSAPVVVLSICPESSIAAVWATSLTW